MKWYLLAFKKYAVFTGRSHREEFWMFVLFHIIASIIVRILDSVVGISLFATLYSLAVLIPGMALTVRRFHDIGKSGWNYAWMMIIGFVSAAIYIGYVVMLAVKAGLKADDIDMSVVMQFMMPTLVFVLVMLVIFIWWLVNMVRDSQPGTNKWGPNPKEAEIPGFTSLPPTE